ncbi:patellin-3-like, partial [Trifolium medium]|nr:patellin-3-like [Trifolium medium]
MADEVPKLTTQEAVVANKTESTDEPKPIPEPEKKPVENNTLETVTETDVSKPGDDEKVPEPGSFKEESTIVGELPEAEKKALQELKQLI